MKLNWIQSQKRHTSNIDSNPNESEDDELNLLNANKKGVRSCTNHLIYNFTSYKSLSLGYRVFVTSLTDIQIPNNIQEALQIPKWKTTIEGRYPSSWKEWDIGACWTSKGKESSQQ